MFQGVRRLPLRFWLDVLVGGVFTLARFSEAFLILRTLLLVRLALLVAADM